MHRSHTALGGVEMTAAAREVGDDDREQRPRHTDAHAVQELYGDAPGGIAELILDLERLPRFGAELDRMSGQVRNAFIAAEDKRFYQHKGIDERGLIRAFIGNLAQSGRPQGGSTITQQVVKNLLVGDDVTYERKIREILVTSRLEHTLTKPEILELYLNSIYLGRNSWGVEMAAKSYFGKSAKDLDLSEAALLAGLTKGPNYFSPDRAADRARERYAYVLTRMQEDGFIDAGSGGGIGWGLCDDITRPVIHEERIVEARAYHTIKEAKYGQGPAPIRTAGGWLQLAHGVRNVGGADILEVDHDRPIACWTAATMLV